MGLTDRIINRIKNNKKNISTNEDSNKEEILISNEEIKLLDDQIMDIVQDNILDTNSTKAISIYKHNLSILVKEALKKGYIDKFYLIREDNHFPKGFEWSVASDETSFESTSLELSSRIRTEIATNLTGNKTNFNGIQILLPSEKMNENMKQIDKQIGNIYLPTHFRSTKHFTINTPLEITGDYNSVETNRNFIIIDEINNFLNSGYGYSIDYKDAYLDVSHEPLKISNKAIILIENSKFEELIKDEEIKNQLMGKNIIRYKGDIILAINMILTQLGALPSKVGNNYFEYDNRIYEIFNKSMEKIASDNNLQYKRSHFGKKSHFTAYYDEKNQTTDIYINEFCNYLKQKFPEHKDLIAPNIITNNDRTINHTSSKLEELINKIGIDNLLEAINKFNAAMKEIEKDNYQTFINKKNEITPEMSSMFKKTIKLIDHYYNDEYQTELDNKTINEIEKNILEFLQSKSPKKQYEKAIYLNNIISKIISYNNQETITEENTMHK